MGAVVTGAVLFGGQVGLRWGPARVSSVRCVGCGGCGGGAGVDWGGVGVFRVGGVHCVRQAR